VPGVMRGAHGRAAPPVLLLALRAPERELERQRAVRLYSVGGCGMAQRVVVVGSTSERAANLFVDEAR
jgi:hypothetical protein